MNLNLPSIPSTDPIHENWYLPSRRTRRRRWRHGRTSIGAMPHYSCYSIHSINIHIGSYGAAPWWKQSCTFTPLTSQVARTQIVIHWCDRWCYWTYWTPFRVKQRWTPWLLLSSPAMMMAGGDDGDDALTSFGRWQIVSRPDSSARFNAMRSAATRTGDPVSKTTTMTLNCAAPYCAR